MGEKRRGMGEDGKGCMEWVVLRGRKLKGRREAGDNDVCHVAYIGQHDVVRGREALMR